MATKPYRQDFDVEVTPTGLGLNFAQWLGTTLWLPMLLMALMAFPVALILAFVRAGVVAQGSQPAQAAALGQFEVAAVFLGFASVFAAISFAIARILGVLRRGGGSVQETARRAVHTLRMPLTAWLFIVGMMMAMMLLVAAVIGHVILGINVAGASADDTSTFTAVATWSEWLEGVRRFGVSTYLVSIALGLATIVKVLHFQSVRVRELPAELPRAGQPAA